MRRTEGSANDIVLVATCTILYITMRWACKSWMCAVEGARNCGEARLSIARCGRQQTHTSTTSPSRLHIIRRLHQHRINPKYTAMFRGPFDDESADEDDATARQEPMTMSDATDAGLSTSQAPTNAPATRQDPSSYTTGGTAPARASFLPPNLPSQTTREPTSNERHSTAARTCQPSRAAHTLPTASPISSSAHPAPPMTTSEIDALLQPVKDLLQKLKTTTLPPDNGRVSAKPAIQVLRDRVLPVGRYVLQRLGGLEGERGEGDVW